jgi:5'-nucleotidase
MTSPLILVTNDDGIAAPGLNWLARAAVEHGLEVVVAAPQHESSGTSAALTAVTADGRVVFEQTNLPELDGVKAFSVAASPSYIVVLASIGAFGRPPDIVLSGVNRGANAGQAVLHSGTVGAALTAANNGARGMAASLDVLTAAMATAGSGGAAINAINEADDASRHWDTAASLVRRFLPWLIGSAPGTVLNLNVPDRPLADIKGVRRASLAPFGQVQMAVAETGADFVRTALADVANRNRPGTDVALLGEGYATITPVYPVREAHDTTLPDDLVEPA